MVKLYVKEYNKEEGEYEDTFNTCDIAVEYANELVDAGEIEYFWVQDENGKTITSGEDYFGYGKVQILTYNTVANTADSMWVSSNGNFDLASDYGVPSYPNYAFRVKVGINQGNLTFSSDKAENADGDYPVTITEGKILKNAGHQNNGSAADSIVFFISYEGDPWYPADGYAKYKVSGVRYSGIAEND